MDTKIYILFGLILIIILISGCITPEIIHEIQNKYDNISSYYATITISSSETEGQTQILKIKRPDKIKATPTGPVEEWDWFWICNGNTEYRYKEKELRTFNYSPEENYCINQVEERFDIIDILSEITNESRYFTDVSEDQLNENKAIKVIITKNPEGDIPIVEGEKLTCWFAPDTYLLLKCRHEYEQFGGIFYFEDTYNDLKLNIEISDSEFYPPPTVAS